MYTRRVDLSNFPPSSWREFCLGQCQAKISPSLLPRNAEWKLLAVPSSKKVSRRKLSSLSPRDKRARRSRELGIHGADERGIVLTFVGSFWVMPRFTTPLFYCLSLRPSFPEWLFSRTHHRIQKALFMGSDFNRACFVQNTQYYGSSVEIWK